MACCLNVVSAEAERIRLPRSTHTSLAHNTQLKQSRSHLIAKASDPIVASRAIHHALTNPYPKTRYLVGNVNGKD